MSLQSGFCFLFLFYWKRHKIPGRLSCSAALQFVSAAAQLQVCPTACGLCLLMTLWSEQETTESVTSRSKQPSPWRHQTQTGMWTMSVGRHWGTGRATPRFHVFKFMQSEDTAANLVSLQAPKWDIKRDHTHADGSSWAGAVLPPAGQKR